PRQLVRMMRRNEAGEDRPLGVTLRDLDDDRQDALHPRCMPERVVGEQILHVDAEMGGPWPEPTKAQRAGLRHLLRHTGLTNAGRPRVPASSLVQRCASFETA